MKARRVLVLMNPGSRTGGDVVAEVQNHLSARGLEVVKVEDGGPNHFARAIREYATSVDLVAVGGGDGSMNAALPTLMEVGLPLAVLPLGTANNLARSLGIPLTLAEACDVIANGEIRQIDLGWVNGHYFFNVAGIGVSIKVNKHVPAESKKRWGMLAYMVTAFQVLKKFRPFWAEIKSPNHFICLRSLQISVVNGKHFGSGLTVANDASIDDGAIDLCSVEVRRWTEIPRLVARMRGGDYHSPSVQHFRDTEFTITTHHPMPIDTDGEITTMTPAHFKVFPKAFPMMAPKPGSLGLTASPRIVSEVRDVSHNQ